MSRQRLREIPRVRQSGTGHLHRRWFTSPSVDLYVWEDELGVVAFELCYGKPRAEHSVTWSTERGVQHARIDDGESTPFDQRTPIAIAIGAAPLDREAVALALEAVGADLPAPLLRHLLRVLYLGR